MKVEAEKNGAKGKEGTDAVLRWSQFVAKAERNKIYF